MAGSGSKPSEYVFRPHKCPSGNYKHLRMDEHSCEAIAIEGNVENTMLLSSVTENLM